ncbi:unnamed protein product [marine sediment metagenome]|uniref:Uncharacterized protein n=1 Tax=marine sediment metagenome TaxID=412755 RepID=X1EB73_9ZZZZ
MIRSEGDMKIIFATGLWGEPIKLVLTDELLVEAHKALSTMSNLPWRGFLYLNVPCKQLPYEDDSMFHDMKTRTEVNLEVSKIGVVLCYSGWESMEYILDNPNEDIFSIPDVYVTESFKDRLNGWIHKLTDDEKRLITIWRLK